MRRRRASDRQFRHSIRRELVRIAGFPKSWLWHRGIALTLLKDRLRFVSDMSRYTWGGEPFDPLKGVRIPRSLRREFAR